MMIKALLAWAGVMAVRAPILRSVHPRNDEAHEAANREQAIFAGSQAVVRRAHRLSEIMDSDPTNTPRINRGIDNMRALTAEVARRADR
ncbi:MAG: hypothetical protein ACRYGP_28405 [Janthinobacterium lividum]